MKKTLLVLAMVAAAAMSANANTITLWDFQDHYFDSGLNDWVVTEEYTPEIGAGTWAMQGGVEFDPEQEDYRDIDNPEELNSSTDPIHNDFEFMGLALDSDDYPAPFTANKTAGVAFFVPTVGYTDIQVSFDVRLKEESSKYNRFQYTTDGVTWVDGDLFVANNPYKADLWYSYAVNLTGVSGVSDNALFGFRVVSEFGPSGTYEPAFFGISYGRDGLRFDMVRVSGTVVPEPASMTILGAGVAGLLGLVRRRK